jgi:hypothetical protein
MQIRVILNEVKDLSSFFTSRLARFFTSFRMTNQTKTPLQRIVISDLPKSRGGYRALLFQAA